MGLFRRIKKMFRKPAMTGVPPSRRGHWRDPDEHARDFGERYADLLDQCVALRMEALGIPKEHIGMPDDARRISWAAFHPRGTEGGCNAPDGRLVVDSGLFQLDLLEHDYGGQASKLYRTADLTSRLDAIIAHEYEEHRHGGSHLAALAHAHRTELPITERAREIGKAMERGWRH